MAATTHRVYIGLSPLPFRYPITCVDTFHLVGEEIGAIQGAKREGCEAGLDPGPLDALGWVLLTSQAELIRVPALTAHYCAVLGFCEQPLRQKLWMPLRSGDSSFGFCQHLPEKP